MLKSSCCHVTAMMTRQEASSLGGKAVFKKYGREYMQAIGRKGAQAFWAKYKLVPIQANNFAIVNKETNEIVATQLPF